MKEAHQIIISGEQTLIEIADEAEFTDDGEILQDLVQELKDMIVEPTWDKKKLMQLMEDLKSSETNLKEKIKERKQKSKEEEAKRKEEEEKQRKGVEEERQRKLKAQQNQITGKEETEDGRLRRNF